VFTGTSVHFFGVPFPVRPFDARLSILAQYASVRPQMLQEIIAASSGGNRLPFSVRGDGRSASAGRSARIIAIAALAPDDLMS
jgi:hypothetical protein